VCILKLFNRNANNNAKRKTVTKIMTGKRLASPIVKSYGFHVKMPSDSITLVLLTLF